MGVSVSAYPVDFLPGECTNEFSQVWLTHGKVERLAGKVSEELLAFFASKLPGQSVDIIDPSPEEIERGIFAKLVFVGKATGEALAICRKVVAWFFQDRLPSFYADSVGEKPAAAGNKKRGATARRRARPLK